MLKSVLFVSRDAFQNHIKASPAMIAISIGAMDEAAPRLDRGFAGAIRLVFEDAYEESQHFAVGDLPDLHPRHAQGVRIFVGHDEFCDFNDALRIVNFLNHYAAKPEAFELVVHCQAGISRSAAVAQFAADRYGIPILNANPDTSAANKRLLRLLNKAADNQPATVFLPPVSRPAAKPGQTHSLYGIF